MSPERSGGSHLLTDRRSFRASNLRPRPTDGSRGAGGFKVCSRPGLLPRSGGGEQAGRALSATPPVSRGTGDPRGVPPAGLRNASVPLISELECSSGIPHSVTPRAVCRSVRCSDLFPKFVASLRALTEDTAPPVSPTLCRAPGRSAPYPRPACPPWAPAVHR